MFLNQLNNACVEQKYEKKHCISNILYYICAMARQGENISIYLTYDVIDKIDSIIKNKNIGSRSKYIQGLINNDLNKKENDKKGSDEGSVQKKSRQAIKEYEKRNNH